MQLEQQVDKILSTVLDTQGKVNELTARVSHLEDQHARTYEKLDGFLVLNSTA